MADLLSDFDATLRAFKNLGTFSTTKMMPGALEIFNRFAVINAVDLSSYPELEQVIQHCGQFILSLFHAPRLSNFSALPTSGSSEAVFLSILLLKHHWKMQHPGERLPNIVISPMTHIAFNVAAKALNIEVRTLPAKENLEFEQKTILEYIDKNTIAFVCALGDTVTLNMEAVETVNTVLALFHQQNGHFIPIHVDAASGGFIAPFHYPEFIWDFRLNHVKAINVSSHKFGLVYPSLGWICIDNAYCLSDLSHTHSYLGKTFKRYVIQFSHSAAQLAAQYHNIIHLGRAGYQKLIEALYSELAILVEEMRRLNVFTILTPNHLPAIPGVIFTTKMPQRSERLLELSEFLRGKGWHLPTFSLNHLPGQPMAARIIVRHGFTAEIREAFLAEVRSFLAR